jgi:hypothetical protein
VTGGSALGIVSTGSDTLMATTVQPSLAGGGYSGAGLPAGQQAGLNGAPLNGGVLNPQAESGNPQDPPKAKSSAGAVLAGKLTACMAGVLGLLLPALL